jgi:hypothetical protein
MTHASLATLSSYFGIPATIHSRSTLATVVNAGLFTFSYTFLTNTAFGVQLFSSTGGAFGVEQTFLSSGLSGLFMAVAARQPLVLCGVTAPTTILYIYIYSFTDANSIPYTSFVLLVSLWTFLLHCVVAGLRLNDRKYLVYITRFTSEIFEALVAGDFVTASIIGFVEEFHVSPLNGVFQLLLGLVFTVLSMWLLTFNGGGVRFFTTKFRGVVGQFGAIFSLVGVAILSFVPLWTGGEDWAQRVDVADSTFGAPNLGLTSAVNLLHLVPTNFVFVAIIPAFLVTLLFYVDQNLSALLATSLLKSPQDTFDFDFALLGITVLMTGLLGLPPSVAFIPQNPMHTNALLTNASNTRELVVVEQRISALIHALLQLLTLLMLPVVSLIPLCILWGSFLLLATEAFGSTFLLRLLLTVTSRKTTRMKAWDEYRHVLDNVPRRTINVFTAVQFALWLMTYVTAVLLPIIFPAADGNEWVVVGALFPLLIALCGVFRFTAMRKLIARRELRVLDESAGTFED